MKKLGIVCLLFILGWAQIAFGQNIPDRPNPPRLVNDYTNTLTADQQAALERKLVAFDDSTSTQIAVIIVSTLEGNDISDYALKIGRSWGIGGKEYNNGVVFLIAKDDRKMNISTGYGVEGALPDITAKHIIEDEVKPNFKGNDYYRGIDQGTNAIIKAVQGEYKTPRKKDNNSAGKIVIVLVIILVLLSMGSGGGGGSMMSRRGHRGFGGPMFFPMGGGFGGSSGGGSSGGGSFGGFGGGSFGGGGASGGW
jgi:uncharacterized protein